MPTPLTAWWRWPRSSRAHAEHTMAREQGRSRWYAGFDLRVAKVERAYGMR